MALFKKNKTTVVSYEEVENGFLILVDTRKKKKGEDDYLVDVKKYVALTEEEANRMMTKLYAEKTNKKES